ncbi:MAG: efflux RND transporter periplasmic adaptor subunit [Planctomyces sp.]|nr:efflux RND transporter periplasmic adaptor subunit [Planctomyces sp.]
MSKAAATVSALKTWILLIAMSAVVILMLLWIAGVFHEKVSQSAGGSSESSATAASTRTAVATLTRHQRVETFSGTVRPVHESAVASRLLARVVEVLVTAGQAVQKDDVLIRLDDADLQTQFRQAEASVAVAEVQAKQAATDYERATELRKQNAVSQSEFDMAVTALKSGEAGLERARQALGEATVRLEFATIRAPMSGTIIEKSVETGDTVTPGQSLVTIYDPAKMQMIASVRESLAMKLTPGDTIPTRLESLGYECEATISEVVPEADASTRSMIVKVTGPCPPGVYSGMFGRLMIPVGEDEVLTIPVSAVRRIGQLTVVEVVEGDHAIRRNIRIGRRFDDQVEVLAGLSEGDVVTVQ